MEVFPDAIFLVLPKMQCLFKAIDGQWHTRYSILSSFSSSPQTRLLVPISTLVSYRCRGTTPIIQSIITFSQKYLTQRACILKSINSTVFAYCFLKISTLFCRKSTHYDDVTTFILCLPKLLNTALFVHLCCLFYVFVLINFCLFCFSSFIVSVCFLFCLTVFLCIHILYRSAARMLY